MGISKEYTARSQAVDVRCLDLGVSTQATDPVVEVIHTDQQDIRTFLQFLCQSSGAN